MQQMTLKISIIVLLLPGMLLTMERPQANAHDRASHNPSDSTGLPTIRPEHARQLLVSIAPLSMAQQDTKDVNVKSTALCFCLHKGDETIQELRHLQAEWFDRGIRSFEAQDYTGAITAFTRVINMNMRDARVYINRGLSHAHRGDYRQARQDLTQAIDLNHHQAEAYYARGLIALIMEDIPAARLNLQTALHLNYAPAQRLIGRVKERDTER